MLPNKDIKSFLRDLVYLEETAMDLARGADVSAEDRQRIIDNLVEKQVIITKILAFIV